jgi:hypothetical protein
MIETGLTEIDMIQIDMPQIDMTQSREAAQEYSPGRKPRGSLRSLTKLRRSERNKNNSTRNE